jgi:hypothetical protein
MILMIQSHTKFPIASLIGKKYTVKRTKKTKNEKKDEKKTKKNEKNEKTKEGKKRKKRKKRKNEKNRRKNEDLYMKFSFSACSEAPPPPLFQVNISL